MVAGSNPNPSTGAGNTGNDDAAKAEAAKVAEAAKAEAAQKAAAAAAEKAAGMIVLKRSIQKNGEELAAGAELDPSEEWVKRAVLPFDDLYSTREVWDAEQVYLAAMKKAEEAKAKALAALPGIKK